MIKFDIITIFPEIFDSYFKQSIIQRAIKQRLIKVGVHNLRKWTDDRRKTVDDRPFGGGLGMVMKVEPILKAIRSLKLKTRKPCLPAGRYKVKTILFTPRGKKFNQKMAHKLSKFDHLVLICGRYEGVDERVAKYIADEEVSMGEYVLMGGELPAMVVADAVVRRIPGVLGCAASGVEESISSGLLEYPQFTRPAEFRGWTVPDVLLSGHHGAVDRWRREQSLLRTVERRPDLLASAPLTDTDRKFLAKVLGAEGLARLLAAKP